MKRRSTSAGFAGQPWGRVATVLTACFVTLLGVICQLEPLTILQRAALASVVTGLIAYVAASAFRLASAKNKRAA